MSAGLMGLDVDWGDDDIGDDAATTFSDFAFHAFQARRISGAGPRISSASFDQSHHHKKEDYCFCSHNPQSFLAPIPPPSTRQSMASSTASSAGGRLSPNAPLSPSLEAQLSHLAAALSTQEDKAALRLTPAAHRDVVQNLMMASKRGSLVRTPDSSLSRSSTRLSTSTTSTLTEYKPNRTLSPPKSSTSRGSSSPIAAARPARPLPSIPDHSSSLHFHIEESDEDSDPEPSLRQSLKTATKAPLKQPLEPRISEESTLSRDTTDLSEAEDSPQVLTKFPSPPRSTSSVGESLPPRGGRHQRPSDLKRSSVVSSSPSFASSQPATPADSTFGPFSAPTSPPPPSVVTKSDDCGDQQQNPDWPPFGTFADPNALAPSSWSFRSGSISTRPSVRRPKRHPSRKGPPPASSSGAAQLKPAAAVSNDKRASASFLDVSDEEDQDDDDDNDRDASRAAAQSPEESHDHPRPLASDFGLHHFMQPHQRSLVRSDSLNTNSFSAHRSVADVPEDAQSILSNPSQYSAPAVILPTYHPGANSLASESLGDSESAHLHHGAPSVLLPAANASVEIIPASSGTSDALCSADASSSKEPTQPDFNPYHLSPEAYTKRENGLSSGRPAFKKAWSGMFQRRGGGSSTPTGAKRPDHRAAAAASDAASAATDDDQSSLSATSSIKSGQLSTASSSGYLSGAYSQTSGSHHTTSRRPQWHWKPTWSKW